jgi:hopanoid biosynthesis associated RND transporter like protein HpnN
MKTPSVDNLAARILAQLARLVIHHRSWFLWPQAVLFVGCILYTVFYLEFDTTRSSLVGANKKYHQLFQQFKKEFPTQDDMVVVVESDNAEKNRQFVERLGAKIEAARIRVPVQPGVTETVVTNLFARVFYKGDLKMLGSKALLFVDEEDLLALKQRLLDYQPFIQPFTRTTNLVSLFDMVNTQFRTAKREQNEQTDSLVRALPALERIIVQATASLRRSGAPPSPGVFALFDEGKESERSVYITFAEGRIYLVTAQALTASLNRPAMERLRQLLEETRAEVGGVNAGLTGEPVLELDEMQQSQKDSTVASVVSLIICALIFIYGYNETGRPLKATICLIVGIAYTMAFATAAVGHLNILTITFVPILIGLAIDFGVHLVTRYEEELRHGRTAEESITKALVYTGQGIFTGAFTTAGAFLAMMLTDFKGIQEMGIICGGGLLVCLVPMMTLLPVLLLRGRQNVIDHKDSAPDDARERIEKLWLQRPITVMVLTLATCAICATQFRKVHFDYNLLNMQSAGLPAVEFEEKLINASMLHGSQSATNKNGRSLLFAAVIADSVTEAVELEKRLVQLPAVAEVDSIAKFLAENPTGKLELIGAIKQGLTSINFAPPDTNQVNVKELSRSLFSLRGYAGLAQQDAEKNAPEIATKLSALKVAIDMLRKEMFRLGPSGQDAVATKLTDYQRALFEDLRDTFEALQHQDNRERLRIEDLPAALRERFVGVSGKHLLQVYPKKNVWERENQEEFVNQLRTIVPDVTGTPVQLLEYTTLLKNSYEYAALYSLAAIALLVFVHFRHLGLVFLTLVPVIVGSVWLAGVMGAFNIPFNPANIMTLPLVIGIGVTNGIHILNRFAEERSPSILAKSTGKAVLVSGLTTIAGFGSLVLAKHRGIESLGLVMATGVATCMFAGLTFLPAILTLMTRNRNPDKNRPSADNAQSTLGREEPR